MLAKLIDVRVNDFTPKNETEEIKGYTVSFIIEAQEPDKYIPKMVSFYVAKKGKKGFGKAFEKILGEEPYLSSLDGLGDFQIGYTYSPSKKLQSLSYLSTIID